MLTTLEAIRRTPGLNNLASYPDAWMVDLIGEASEGINRWCKRVLNLTSWVEYYSGDSTRNVVLRQRPLWVGTTTIAQGSNGATLPQSTIYAASVANFPSYTKPGGTPHNLGVQVIPPGGQAGSAWAWVTYTGTATDQAGGGPRFTGCSGGVGTLSSVPNAQGIVNGISTPVAFYDQGGYWGQSPQAFQANLTTGQSTQLVLGTQFAAQLDSGGTKSNRGLLEKIGGAGQGFIGYYPETLYQGKLAGTRLPFWPRGDGNIKVAYSAGYAQNDLPLDLSNACKQLVVWMARNNPSGSPLSSESLGGYSYSVLTENTDFPDIMSVCRILARYRESSL